MTVELVGSASAPSGVVCASFQGQITALRKLLPELLPFLCQTDAFFEHAIGTSAGSLSPRTNWSSLAYYEFALPPLEEQKRITEVLRAADKLHEQHWRATGAASDLFLATLFESFEGFRERVALQSCCRLPITYGIVQAGPNLQEGIPYLRVSEMTGRDRIDPRSLMRTSEAISKSYERTLLEPKDIVMALRGVPGLCHLAGEELAGANLSRGVARIAPAKSVDPAFLFWALRSPQSQAAVRQYANGWKGEALREITISQLRALPIPMVQMEIQRKLAERISQAHQAWVACRERCSRFRDFQRVLLDTALGAGQ